MPASRTRDRTALQPVLVGAAATLLLALAQAPLRHEAVPHGDDLIYERMAQHPFATHTFPFAYRLAMPTLVHVLPFSHHTSFLLLTILAAGAASGFLFALMRALGTPERLAWILALSFALSPPVLVAVLRNGRSPDPATLLVMCAAALFVVRRRPWALAITLLLGAFVRESTMFLVPFAYAIWAERLVDLRALRRTIAVALPAIAVYVALRLALPTVGRAQVVGYAGGVLSERVHVLRAALRSPAVELRRVLLAFGPLWLVAPLALRELRYARRGLILLALCAVAATYALDWERIFVLAAPLVYPAAGFALKDRRRLRVAVVCAWLALIVGYGAYMQRSGVVDGIDHGGAPTYPVR